VDRVSHKLAVASMTGNITVDCDQVVEELVVLEWLLIAVLILALIVIGCFAVDVALGYHKCQEDRQIRRAKRESAAAARRRGLRRNREVRFEEVQDEELRMQERRIFLRQEEPVTYV
jgi:hypothetical protein